MHTKRAEDRIINVRHDVEDGEQEGSWGLGYLPNVKSKVAQYRPIAGRDPTINAAPVRIR